MLYLVYHYLCFVFGPIVCYISCIIIYVVFLGSLCVISRVSLFMFCFWPHCVLYLVYHYLCLVFGLIVCYISCIISYVLFWAHCVLYLVYHYLCFVFGPIVYYISCIIIYVLFLGSLCVISRVSLFMLCFWSHYVLWPSCTKSMYYLVHTR